MLVVSLWGGIADEGAEPFGLILRGACGVDMSIEDLSDVLHRDGYIARACWV